MHYLAVGISQLCCSVCALPDTSYLVRFDTFGWLWWWYVVVVLVLVLFVPFRSPSLVVHLPMQNWRREPAD